VPLNLGEEGGAARRVVGEAESRRILDPESLVIARA